jgi:hypothetical protein
VIYANPAGVVANSDLELATSLAQHDVLAQIFDIQEVMIHNSSGNMVMVWWQRKGVTSNSGPTARLLRFQALHQ